jgi:NADH-quinone oxidoreductase subunit H
MSTHAELWAAPLLTIGALGIGVTAVAVLDGVAARVVSGAPLTGAVALAPLRRVATLSLQQPSRTEHPDPVLWALAPALYFALAALGLTLVPWTRTFSIADVDAGIVLWGTAEALVLVAVYLHGWAPNSHQPLLAAYRFVAIGVSYLLLSMFVLIAAAIPAESLQLSRIVEAQSGLWNVVRQPLGLPLFAVVALGSSSWGPMNLADGDDLCGGTQAEVSALPRLAWSVARAAMLTSFAAMSATVFLGGWNGPLLPGPLWSSTTRRGSTSRSGCSRSRRSCPDGGCSAPTRWCVQRSCCSRRSSPSA